MNANTAVQIENIYKSYKLYRIPSDRLKEALNPFGKKYHISFFALQNISLEVMKGETIGIIGKNGSGKSTLLKIITGVLSPTSGFVTLEGRVSALLELGAGFNPEMSGRENIYLNGSMMGYSRADIDVKIPQILEFADIGDFIDQQVKTYSSGMFTRLAFALAIHVDPDILIVDEALAVGDMAFQMKCYRKFNDFKEAGKTIIFVSHSLDSILRYCDRAVVLHEGGVVACGNTKEMVDIYKRLLVNCFDPDTDETNGKKAADTGMDDNATRWKDQLPGNPNVLVYGDGTAEIIDYGMFDKDDLITNNVISGETISFRMKVRFHAKIVEPLFAFTIKDVKGNEISGTNTMFEMIPTDKYRPEDEAVITFSQRLSLRGGGYTVSFGCVHYKGDELAVCQRIYDAILFEVYSTKQVVGVYDMNSNITIKRRGKSQ